ncbi:MAG: hypothetical protein WCE88_04210, partial [Burkholderiales bacterium]
SCPACRIRQHDNHWSKAKSRFFTPFRMTGCRIPPASCYNHALNQLAEQPIMEAERLNLIANQLTDMNTRAAELRRYL